MIRKLVANFVLPVTFIATCTPAGALTEKDLGFLTEFKSVLPNHVSLVSVNYERSDEGYTLTEQDADFINSLTEVLGKDTLTWMEHNSIDIITTIKSAKAACSNLSNGQPVLDVIEESASWVDRWSDSERTHAAWYAFSADTLGIGFYCPEFYKEYTTTFKALTSDVASEKE